MATIQLLLSDMYANPYSFVISYQIYDDLKTANE